MCVLGGVFVQKTITQPLIDYIWLGSDPFDSTQQVFVAQLFKSAIKILPIHWTGFAELDCQGDSLPLHHWMQSRENQVHVLVSPCQWLLIQVPVQGKAWWHAIIVKFAEWYNMDAHHLLAAKGLALTLYYSSTNGNMYYGKHFIIVIDHVELQPLLGRPTKHQYKHVKKAITTLYSNRMVFSDLRQPNILVRDNTVIWVDFNWCREVGKGH